MDILLASLCETVHGGSLDTKPSTMRTIKSFFVPLHTTLENLGVMTRKETCVKEPSTVTKRKILPGPPKPPPVPDETEIDMFPEPVDV